MKGYEPKGQLPRVVLVDRSVFAASPQPDGVYLRCLAMHENGAGQVYVAPPLVVDRGSSRDHRDYHGSPLYVASSRVRDL